MKRKKKRRRAVEGLSIRLTRVTPPKLTRLACGQSTAHTGPNPLPPPQFYINYSVVTQEQVSIDTYNSSFYGSRHYGNSFYGGSGYSDTRVKYYTQGTLVIDIIDANKNLLVWRASAASKLKSGSTPQQNEADMSAILDQLFTGFPPQ